MTVLQRALVAREKLPQPGFLVGRRAERPAIVTALHALEQFRDVELARILIDGERYHAFLALLLADMEEILRNAVEDVVGDRHERLLEAPGGDRLAAELQRESVRAADVEHRDVQQPGV